MAKSKMDHSIKFRSVADLSAIITSGLWQLPSDIDLVVGVPRSGMLPATIIATLLGVPLVDLGGFLENRSFNSGRRISGNAGPTRKALVVDDSVATGAANAILRERLRSNELGDIEVILAAVYVQAESKHLVDFYFEEVSGPRIFEWNFTNHYLLPSACVDIDGVLCRDPIESENDDGDRYREFILNAEPHFRFKGRIGWLVTNRLEKFRAETEEWLKRQGVDYGELIMLDLPSKEARLQNGPHGRYKTIAYNNLPASLFIESEIQQARYIAAATGKPVLCTDPFLLVQPTDQEKFLGKAKRAPRSMLNRLSGKLKRTFTVGSHRSTEVAS